MNLRGTPVRFPLLHPIHAVLHKEGKETKDFRVLLLLHIEGPFQELNTYSRKAQVDYEQLTRNKEGKFRQVINGPEMQAFIGEVVHNE